MLSNFKINCDPLGHLPPSRLMLPLLHCLCVTHENLPRCLGGGRSWNGRRARLVVMSAGGGGCCCGHRCGWAGSAAEVLRHVELGLHSSQHITSSARQQIEIKSKLHPPYNKLCECRLA